jgi:hypothetical protein
MDAAPPFDLRWTIIHFTSLSTSVDSLVNQKGFRTKEELRLRCRRARDPGAFKSVLVRINTEGWRALKMMAVEKDTTLNALAVEAFNDLLKKHGKRQSVENPLLD